MARLSWGFMFLLAGALSVSAQTAPGPTHSGQPTNCNRWHIVVDGDNCDTVRAQYSLSATQFFNLNPAVSRDCITNFWLGYAYCVGTGASLPTTTTTRPTTTTSSQVTTTIHTTPPGPTFTGTPANCNRWHLVVDGDTCDTIRTQYSLSATQFFNMNPAVSRDCTTNFWLGSAYCVGLGPAITTTTGGSTGTSTSSTPTSSFNSTYSIRHPIHEPTIIATSVNETWPPQRTQAGQPSYCTNWHLVGPAEDCASIVFEYSDWMTLDDFIAWNPAVGTDCSGLYLNYYVCVDIQPQTTGVVLVPTFAPANETTLPPYVSWTEPVLPTIDPNWAPTPSHGPMPTNCVNYLRAEEGYTCEDLLEAQPQVSREEFFAWNPVLNGNCGGLWANNYYCLGAYDEGWYPQPPTVNTRPSSVPEGTTSQCARWYQATPGDTCESIEQMFGSFSQATFLTWNPAARDACTSGEEFEEDVWYCVGVPGTPTTRTSSLEVPTSFPPDDDETSAPGSTTTTPPTSSTVLTTRTSTSAPTTTPSTTAPPPTTTTATAVETPQPIQGQMVSGCRRFYFVQPGDGCWQISFDAGIDLSDFYTWNPAAAPDCSGMWANVYVCVGIAGPVATFSGTPPRPT